ncbi:MAG: hypothetical protein EXR74_06920 [Bdellovibrionales bacterium]|nr:hypothetical protein [Bdellovibrionales bacterium]
MQLNIYECCSLSNYYYYDGKNNSCVLEKKAKKSEGKAEEMKNSFNFILVVLFTAIIFYASVPTKRIPSSSNESYPHNINSHSIDLTFLATSKASSSFVDLPPEAGFTINQLTAIARDWVTAGLRVGAISPLALRLFGEIGRTIGQSAEFVAMNWKFIGPSLNQVQAYFRIGGLLSAGASLLPYVPTVLAALTAAGLIPLAIYEARIRANRANALNESREWQLNRAEYLTFFQRSRRNSGHIRLPSIENGADVIISGPNANNVAEGIIQNYINAAFIARENPSRKNIQMASTLLGLIRETASE